MTNIPARHLAQRRERDAAPLEEREDDPGEERDERHDEERVRRLELLRRERSGQPTCGSICRAWITHDERLLVEERPEERHRRRTRR